MAAERPMILVDAEALMQVLTALNGPGHLIRELQATRNIAALVGEENPIDRLIRQYNAGIADLAIPS